MNAEENQKFNQKHTIENNELLQQYFDNFQKEIPVNEVIQITAQGEIMDEANGPGTYFMDHQGQYYFQSSSDSQANLIADATMDGGMRELTVTDEVSLVDAVSREEEITLNDESGGQMLLPGQVYQTVTIVPSEAPNGEVSYVLIVQQPDGKLQTNEKCEIVQPDNNLTVYDFDENEEMEVTQMDSDEEDDKSKIIKLPQKKSQIVAPAHMCSYCNYTSPKRYLLSRHMKSHSEERPHKCSVCERGFKTLASLQNHVNTHTGTKPHRCRFCESAFTTSGELVRHVRYRHTHEKPHKCHECDYASVELSKLKRHVRCHTGERPYQCEHCTYASPDTFKLKRHMRTHTHEKPYECDFCKMRFTQSNSLKAHKLTHNIGEKPIYPCELCPTTCGRKTDLRIHIQKLHTSDKPLKCKRCGKSFPDRYSYKMHNKSHEGEKCFKCEMCPYASISQHHLNSHMLIHTDEKPFACERCDQTFRQKQLLKRHQNLYHNPDYIPPSPKEKSHECQECGRQFRHKGNLIRHMAMHDPDSAVHEKSLALKLGRQKKIHIIDGQPVEVLAGSSTESEDECLDEAEETSNDMDQYVVLEVIQLQGENNEEPISVINRESSHEHLEIVPKDYEVKEEKKVDPLSTKSFCKKTEKDMKTCFGFDEEEGEENNPEELGDEIIWIQSVDSSFQ